ncbi:MAG: twin-arginine translocase TatA/TatE family subunit [Bacteroidales bacterium]|nr:twin-arginine translocase TatA/TatE family subunit [Bacteroidales bacterium]MCF8456771.1 twin-arginine translocase TatA/TatE family subunit [Bacteroidales bacterium]
MKTVLLFISGAEIFVIIMVVILLFGAKKIPELARGFGKGMNEFRKATADIKKEINNTDGGLMKDVKDIKNSIQETTQNVKRRIEESEIGKDISSVKKNIDRMK